MLLGAETSPDSEVIFPDAKQYEEGSLHHLYLKLNDCVKSRLKKDKVFVKNKLKIQPVIHVSMHRFKDHCSPIAIVDSKLVLAAFKYFSETYNIDSGKSEAQPLLKTYKSWINSYFLENESDGTVNRTSKDSEFRNDISGPEVLCSSNEEFKPSPIHTELNSSRDQVLMKSVVETCNSQQRYDEGNILPEFLEYEYEPELNEIESLNNVHLNTDNVERDSPGDKESYDPLPKVSFKLTSSNRTTFELNAAAASVNSNVESSEMQVHSMETSPFRDSSIMHDVNSLDSKLINNMASKCSILRSHPNNKLGNVRPIKGKRAAITKVLPFKNWNAKQNVNAVSRLDEQLPASSSLVGHSPKLQLLTKLSKSKLRPHPRKETLRSRCKIKKSEPNIPRSLQESISGSAATVEDGTTIAANNQIPPPQRKKLDIQSPLNQHMCASSSLANHSPELSVFTQPPKSKIAVKRKLFFKKEAEIPKLPPYCITTPCKQLKVIRPATPIIKSCSLSFSSPISFTDTPKQTPLIKRPTPITPTDSKRTVNKKLCILSAALNSSKSKSNYQDLKNFTISVQGNSANRKITSTAINVAKKQVCVVSPSMSQNSAGASKIHSKAKLSFSIMKNFSHTVMRKPEGSASPTGLSISVSEKASKGFDKPMLRRTTIQQSRPINHDIPRNVFQRIITFLKSKVLLKCRSSSPDEQLEKATNLAETFIQNNVVHKLDRKTMKLLCEFAEKYVC